MEKSKAKYQGIIPAFYACYDKEGRVSAEKVEELTAHLVEKGVKGLYVGGSSGECIYQDVEERKLNIIGIKGERKTPEEIDAVLAERRKNWKPREPKYKKGVLRLFSQHAASPMKGAYLEY